MRIYRTACTINRQIRFRFWRSVVFYESRFVNLIHSTFKKIVYLCFFNYPYKNCEEFDGISSTNSFLSTNHVHCYGSLGEYNQQMVVLGAGDRPGQEVRRKVELLEVGGWKEIADFPV